MSSSNAVDAKGLLYCQSSQADVVVEAVSSSSSPPAHKFGGFQTLHTQLLKSGSVVCASPAIRAKIYKALDAAGIGHRTEIVEKNTDKVHGLGHPQTERNFSYVQIAKLIRGGRLTLEGLDSAIYAFEEDAYEYKKYRGYDKHYNLYRVLEEHECDDSYSLADFSAAFKAGMTEEQIAQEFQDADPHPEQIFYPLWYARLVKFTKRIELV